MGPNSGATEFGAARAFARAYTCVTSEVFNDSHPLMVAMNAHPHLHGPGVWHRAIFPDGTTWAWTVNADGNGLSQRRPPHDAPLGTSYTIESSDEGFRSFVTDVEKLEQKGQGPSGQPLAESSRRQLRNAVRTGDPQWPSQLTQDVIGSLGQELRTGADLGDVLNRMGSESVPKVAALRRDFGADVHTTVGLTWSMLLVGKVLGSQATAQQKAQVAVSLLGGNQDDPWKLLADVAQALLEACSAEVLVEVADEAREQGTRLIDRALDSETIEEHYDLLYSALTPTYAALAIYRFLAETAKGADGDLYRRVWTQLDERAVRLSHPLIQQVIDLNSDVVWSRHVKLVCNARDDEAAAKAVENLTRGLLFYPTSLGRRLLLTRAGIPFDE